MTRGGGSRSSGSSGSRDPGVARWGWAPFAPPREAPARPGTRPPRGSRARLRRVAAAAAAAAAMSPGKPGAGGAGTRRTGWRRRRRRRRLEAATRAPELGHTAGPDSRVPGTFQGAQGMKPEAREARPPPRSPGLRWALPPLLLLLLLAQIVCSGDAPGSVSETDLALSNNDSQSSRIPPGQENTGELKSEDTTSQSITIGNLSPGTSYLSGTEGTSKTVDSRTVSSPVFGIDAVSISPTSVVLTWKNNDTAASEYTYAVKNERDNKWRMIVTNETECTITGLSPGTSYEFSITPGIANETWGSPMSQTVTTAPSPVFGIHAVSISPTSVVLTWKNDDTAASEYTYAVKNERDNEWRMIVTNETECIITGLSPGTSYEFSITPGIANETWGSPMSQTVTTGELCGSQG
ncbi:hypothetical protein GHT09_002350 [Marmota monax]|uniref:Fibronectin type-III domain-containing protein n=1 Tax=Marmota monax TaxID=9995 RepID=A0A834V6D2_MARMO|nr:hypothetical protein GHT09_002350 [Marmota monax]